MFGRYSVCVWIIDIIYYLLNNTHAHDTWHNCKYLLSRELPGGSGIKYNWSRSLADLFFLKNSEAMVSKKKNLPSHILCIAPPHPLRGGMIVPCPRLSPAPPLVRDKGSCCSRQRPLPAQDGSLASDNIFGYRITAPGEKRYYLERRCGINQ